MPPRKSNFQLVTIYLLSAIMAGQHMLRKTVSHEDERWIALIVSHQTKMKYSYGKMNQINKI